MEHKGVSLSHHEPKCKDLDAGELQVPQMAREDLSGQLDTSSSSAEGSARTFGVSLAGVMNFIDGL
ncbi:hypothetical protein AMTR_s00077p00067320 [Amborella trichopoda]|uniref:Uncharacterized protein n=1 Tax=Amborella trichopoda TaxID=13333 RepID=W1P8Z3_AMBTC|nr:hypothetical protein AMTR_s00077p00067320 [Amborella trichopoda]